MFMDESNKDAIICEVWKIILSESGKDDLSEETQRKLDTLDTMLDNALGINEKNLKRYVTYDL